MESVLEEGVEPIFVAGLEAMVGGKDALLAGLSVAHRQLGAHYSVWMAPGSSGGGYGLCDGERSRRCTELPIELPSGWICQDFRGPLRMIGPVRMGRDPKARALGFEWALVARSTENGSRVWFAAPTALEICETWIHSIVRCLGLLHRLDQGRQRQNSLERLAMMGEQTASVTHDLRNQLSLTRMEFEMARAHPGTSLERADEALGKALALCTDFMSDGLRAKRVPKPLAPRLRTQIEEAVRLSGRQGEVRVVQRCALDLCAVFDDRLLDRYLRNLLLNAFSATPSGGIVRVEAKEFGEDRVALVVTDAGKGMEQIELERLLHAGETLGGTGFGTSSILDCAEKMHADLDVESQPGAGTRISLSLAAQ